MYKKLILGSPGTGKTTRLLAITEEKLLEVQPEKIAFFSFTKKAILEAQERAAKKFKLDNKRFKNFKTIHALAYREVGVQQKQVLGYQHKKQLESITGHKLTFQSIDDNEVQEKGDKLLFLNDYARYTRQDLKDVWAEGLLDVSWPELKQFSETYNLFKKEYQLIDFTDMLEKYLARGEALNIDIAIIDEAQDLNPLQWLVVNKAIANAKEVYIAGDDDQAIYKWSGADVEQFLNLDVTEKEVLPVSYRLPIEIFNFSNMLVSRIKKRYDKNWLPQKRKGEVKYHSYFEQINLKGDWLILSRTNRQLKKLEENLRERGILYKTKHGHCISEDHKELIRYYVAAQKTGNPHLSIKKWFDKNREWYEALDIISLSDREYYRNLLRQGYKLTDEPTVMLSTIHGAKGGEADNVLLLSDMPRQTYDLYLRDPDDEHRVFYVAATRAKQNLHILTPQTGLYYDL